MMDLQRVSAEKTLKVSTDHFFAQPYVSMYNLTEHGWRFTCWSVCFVLFWFLRVSGDSFVVNAFLRRGMEECERYSATDHKLKNMQVALRLFFFCVLFSSLFLPPDNKINSHWCPPFWLKLNEKAVRLLSFPFNDWKPTDFKAFSRVKPKKSKETKNIYMWIQ